MAELRNLDTGKAPSYVTHVESLTRYSQTGNDAIIETAISTQVGKVPSLKCGVVEWNFIFITFYLLFNVILNVLSRLDDSLMKEPYFNSREEKVLWTNKALSSRKWYYRKHSCDKASRATVVRDERSPFLLSHFCDNCGRDNYYRCCDPQNPLRAPSWLKCMESV